MKRVFARLTAVAVTLSAFLMPWSATACSIAGPEPFDEILAAGEIYSQPLVGFYEQQHIAFTPAFFLRGERSASVVSRYWGSPPNLSVASHGSGGFFIGFLFGGGCGDDASNLGETSIHAATEGAADYRRGSISGVDLADPSYPQVLSPAEEAALDERFGPAVAESLGPDDYVLGYTLILWRPLLGLAAFSGLAYLVRSRIRKIRMVRPGRINPAVVAATGVGVTAIALVVASLGQLDWLGMMLAAAASIGVGYLLRTPWALFGPALFLWSAANFNLFAGASFSDSRLQNGIALLLIGVGALAWARGHWTRWPAAFTVTAGAFVFTFGALEVRGYLSEAQLAVAAAAVAAVAAVVIWAIAFRSPGTLNPPDGAPPPGGTEAAGQLQPSR